MKQTLESDRRSDVTLIAEGAVWRTWLGLQPASYCSAHWQSCPGPGGASSSSPTPLPRPESALCREGGGEGWSVSPLLSACSRTHQSEGCGWGQPGSEAGGREMGTEAVRHEQKTGNLGSTFPSRYITVTLALPPCSWETFGKRLSHSEPQFSLLQLMRDAHA